LEKWLVWNGTNWKTDEGGVLIHEKGLETVRNSYNELLKTDNYQERIDIERFAKVLVELRQFHNSKG